MESNELKLQEILKARGITDEQLKEVQEQDIPAAAESFQRIMDIYYLLKVTADMESAYWYNRVWWENDGDLLEVRRAKAVAASLAHSTPTILPYEKLVMNKTKHLRGAFPFPWVCASFFNSLAESLMEEAEAPAENEADSVSVVGAGGSNVTESYGEVISIAKKLGMRKEDIPV
ncbi:pyruvate formate lyase family protein, partial [Anaerotignum sp.]|uniref:pyruvate formate lyase family protein n=1 Tax=Anaerotignum sp. TaxID=2039241 RepID=UPI0039920ACD